MKRSHRVFRHSETWAIPKRGASGLKKERQIIAFSITYSRKKGKPFL